MSDQVVPLARKCPNCGSQNYPNATVCEGCGITLGVFERALPEIEKQKQGATEAHLQQLHAAATAEIKEQARVGRRTLSIQILLAVGVALLVLALVAGVAGWNSYQQQLRRERLAKLYERGSTCLAQTNFRCARDEFGALLQEDPNYGDAKTLRQQAQLGYAQQQIAAGRWQDALDELQQVLSSSPNEPRALQLRNQARVGLAAEYGDQGQWNQAIIELQKVLAIAPNDTNALTLLKESYLRLAAEEVENGRFQNSVNTLERALERFRNDSQLLATLESVYDQWYNNALRSGDWLTALMVSTRRNFRFQSK